MTGRVARRRSRLFIVALVLAAVATLVGGTGAQGQVTLGTAESFAVLANTTITNTGATTIRGNVGLYPGTAVTGFGTVVQTGTLHVADAVAQQALIDATTAYNTLQGRKPCTDLSGKVLGQDVGTAANPLPPGVYCFSSSAQLTGDLYLSGGGEYIFQIGSTLTTASGSRVILLNGADACNVFWAVGSSATLGTNSQFVGTIIANTSITANTGAVIIGRLFALTGAVTLQANTITRPVCTTTTTTTTTAIPATTITVPGTTIVVPGTTTLPTTTTTAPATTTTGLQATTTTGLAATTTTAAEPATTTARSAATTTTVRPGTTGTTAPGDGTRLGAGGPDLLRAAGAGEALALTGPTHLQPMLVAALLAVLLGAIMLMSFGAPGADGLLVAGGPQQGPRRVSGNDFPRDAGTSRGVTPPPPRRAPAPVAAGSDSRRRDVSPAEATRSALRSAESISWTLRLPDA